MLERIDNRTGSGSQGTVRAFSSFEPYELKAYLDAMAADMPDIAVEITRMPTGILAEEFRRLPQAERPCAILGWAESAARIAQFDVEMASVKFASVGRSARFVAPTGFSVAFACDGGGLHDVGLPIPSSWVELCNPRLRGRLMLADPTVSGAGFLMLSTLLQAFGDERGWDMLTRILENARRLEGSSWTPVDHVGSDGVLVGVSVQIAAKRKARSDRAITVSVPREAIGVEREVYGVTNYAKDREAAIRVVSWLARPEGKALFESFSKVFLGASDIEGALSIDIETAVSERTKRLSRFQALIGEKELMR